MADISWTDERVEQLKKLANDGLSCSQIAGELGGITRSAVIGKLHRLGIAKTRPKSTPGPRKPRPRPARSTFNPPIMPRFKINPQLKSTTVLETVEDEAPPLIPNAQPCQLWQLTTRSCRMPCGKPGAASFYFCGSPEADYPRDPYCRACAAGIGRWFAPLTERQLSERAEEHAEERKRIDAMMASFQRKEPEDDGTDEIGQATEGEQGAEENGGRSQRRRSRAAHIPA